MKPNSLKLIALAAPMALLLPFNLAPANEAETESATVGADDLVWHWFAECRDPRSIKLRVTLNGKLKYESKFDVCLMPRRAIVDEPQQRVLSFALRNNAYSLFGETKGDQLEGNFWEASKGENDILIGVSFANDKRVWSNIVHVLNPAAPSMLNLRNGLVIKTLPAGKSDQ